MLSLDIRHKYATFKWPNIQKSPRRVLSNNRTSSKPSAQTARQQNATMTVVQQETALDDGDTPRLNWPPEMLLLDVTQR